jgi:hypothetical protein
LPRLDHHVVVRSDPQRLARFEHVVVQVAGASDPDPPGADGQTTRVARPQPLHPGSRQRPVDEPRRHCTVLQNHHQSLLMRWSRLRDKKALPVESMVMIDTDKVQ